MCEYTGETSRSSLQKGNEHNKNLQDKLEDSPLWKHVSSHHQGIEQQFQMKVIKKHHSAFIRQVSESVIITNGIRDRTMNSKNEWLGERIPRLTIEIGEDVAQKDHDGSALVKTNKKTKMLNQTRGGAKRQRLVVEDKKQNQG